MRGVCAPRGCHIGLERPAGRVLPSAARAGSRFCLAVVEDRRRHAE